MRGLTPFRSLQLQFGKIMKYNKFEKLVARAIDYDIGETDDDMPKTAILSMKYAKMGLYIKLLEKLVAFATCFFIIANAIHHW